jgi:hypothetical protein
LPWTANHVVAVGDEILDDVTRDVAAVDVERPNCHALVVEIVLEHGQRVALGHIGRSDRCRDDEAAIEVRRNVTLVPAERVAAALTAVPHLCVFDRDSPVVRNPIDDAWRSCAGRFLDVLRPDLP